MKVYQPAINRMLLGSAAAAMTALTIGALVVGPALLGAGDGASLTVARTTESAPVATEVAIIPAYIEVVAVREQKTAFERLRGFFDKRKQAG